MVAVPSRSLEAGRPDAILPDTMLPELFLRHPQTRVVFDRYGLRGCGGPTGPQESIGFFAATHGVEPRQLLDEIHTVIADPRQAAAAARELAEQSQARAIDTIYRRFFLAGIAITLTAGAAWGAWLLWRIGLTGSFTSLSIHQVNAHGQAQIFGWVALFIMGFAYQALPRMWHVDLAWPRLAALSFAAMVGGIVVRTAGMTLADAWSAAAATALLGGAMQILAATIFAAQIAVTFRRSGKVIEPYVAFLFAATACFVVQTVFCTVHTWNTMTAATHERMLWHVATYQAVLRDLQIHGMALLMILGVSIRMLPALFGLARVPDRAAWWALGLLTTAVALESAAFITYRHTGEHAWAWLLWGSWMLLPAGVGLVAWRWRLWRPLPVADRSGKFVRAAYGWLALSLAMLLAMPLYQAVSGIAFSHAYYGAIRHAVTVGFISLMIMGFAAKVVATLSGLDTRRLTAMWGPFVLINVGCLLRVGLQTGTDWHDGFFRVVGVSGMLEVTALAWWGAHLIGMMRAGRRAERAACAAEDAKLVRIRPRRIEADHIVADVLAWHPHVQAVLERHGFAAVRNPLLRRTVARVTTLRQAAAMHGVALEALLADLNGLTSTGSGGRDA